MKFERIYEFTGFIRRCERVFLTWNPCELYRGQYFQWDVPESASNLEQDGNSKRHEGRFTKRWIQKTSYKSKMLSEAHTPKRSFRAHPRNLKPSERASTGYLYAVTNKLKNLKYTYDAHCPTKNESNILNGDFCSFSLIMRSQSGTFVLLKKFTLLFITWKKTHLPRSIALLIRASALGPWPCPSDIAFNFFENLISSANLYRATAGSVPGDNTKMRGTEGDESLNTWRNGNRWIINVLFFIFQKTFWGM